MQYGSLILLSCLDRLIEAILPRALAYLLAYTFHLPFCCLSQFGNEDGGSAPREVMIAAVTQRATSAY